MQKTSRVRRGRLTDKLHQAFYVDEWSRANNLTLNHAKSVEVIFRDNRKRCCIHPPSPLQGVARTVTSLKVLGVTLTDRLSLRTWMTSSARVRGPCMPLEYCGLTSGGSRGGSLGSDEPPSGRM